MIAAPWCSRSLLYIGRWWRQKRGIQETQSRSNMSQETADYKTEMRKLLREHSTKKYFIEYIGFMSNHISHGLYALEQLKAPISKAHSFIEWHGQKKLEDAQTHRDRELREEPKPNSVEELVGARRSYYYLYDHYERLLNDRYKGSLEGLLAGEFPRISSGMVGSAVHGLIHTGYGYASREPWFVCEGLAYLHHSNCPPMFTKDAQNLSTLGSGSHTILDVVKSIREDDALILFTREAIKEPSVVSLNTSDFQRKTRVLFRDKADILAGYAHMIDFPAELRAENLALSQGPALAKWLTDCAITVYAIASKPNDFFLIHGVTGAWSLNNILPLLTSTEDMLTTTRAFLCTLFATFLAQNHPGLQVELLSSRAALEHSWESIALEAIKRDKHEEEHVFKLVQVCKAMSEQHQDGNMEPIYRMAAYHCISNPLTF